MKKWARNQQLAFYFNPFILTATTMEAAFRLLMLCCLGLMIFVFGLMYFGIRTIMDMQVGVFQLTSIVIGPQILLVSVMSGYAFSIYRGRKTIQQAEYKLCNHCRYNLKNLGNSGKCPECGNDYEISDLQAYWKSCYGEKKAALSKLSGKKFSYLGQRATALETLLARVCWASTLAIIFSAIAAMQNRSTISFVIAILIFAVVVILQVAYRIAKRAGRKLIRSESYLLCNHCRYSLNSLPDEASCPECGNEYSISEVQEYWKQCYNEPSSI